MAGWPPSSLKQDDFFHCGRDLAACQRRASPLSRGLNMGAFKRATVFSSPSRCSRDVMLCICYGCRLTLTSLRQDQQLSILINVWHLVKSPFGILLRYSGPGQFFLMQRTKGSLISERGIVHTHTPAFQEEPQPTSSAGGPSGTVWRPRPAHAVEASSSPA